MSYLEALTRCGIKASIRPGDVLWLEPKSAITDDIRRMVRENKSAIIEELQRNAGRLLTVKVTAEVTAKVDAIRERALELGWTEAGLYRNRGCYPFPLGQDYGLVCFLSGNRRIGKVTREYVEIICPYQHSMPNRFYNPDVDQPWICTTLFGNRR